MAVNGATAIMAASLNTCRFVDGPLQRLHPPDRTAQDQPEPPDAQRVEKLGTEPGHCREWKRAETLGRRPARFPDRPYPGPVDP